MPERPSESDSAGEQANNEIDEHSPNNNEDEIENDEEVRIPEKN